MADPGVAAVGVFPPPLNFFNFNLQMAVPSDLAPPYIPKSWIRHWDSERVQQFTTHTII